MRLILLSVLALLLGPAAPSARSQTPEWIWFDHGGEGPRDNETIYFRKTFEIEGEPAEAILLATADDQMRIVLNGEVIARSTSWQRAARADVTSHLRPGRNVLAARARNQRGAAGFIAQLKIRFADGREEILVTDTTWLCAREEMAGWQGTEFDDSNWTRPVSHGRLGTQPWGDVLQPPVATTADKLQTLPGFEVELIRTAASDEGSWICMTVDDQGRLIVSPQDAEERLLRLSLTEDGRVEQVERIDQPIGGAMGLLYAFDSLYVSGIGPERTGLYRLRDTNGDDRFDEMTFLNRFEGGGEHGPHAIVRGPDDHLYIMNGNHTKVPEGISPKSPHQNYAEDMLQDRMWDAGGHAVGVLAPGGYVVRTDPEGELWELLLGGFRNAYDLAFNSDGELFTFDSDMEWDWGTPWYRPTRVNHCVVGGEYGWRSGTAKWPDYYADSLPTTVDIGIGSPTGVKFGTDAAFPVKYRRALFIQDWSYGRILAVHLEPRGATYNGTFENFVAPMSLTQEGSRTPLNVSDLEFGKDGAMYFITGGRGTLSGLYRVRYTGPDALPATTPLPHNDHPTAAAARDLRHKLEAFHGRQDTVAIDFAWPHLNSDDRWIRYAARIAIESQNLPLWRERALTESRPTAALTALLALARVGGTETQPALLGRLQAFPMAGLSEAQKLEKLRLIQLSFLRQGAPSRELKQLAISKLSPLYPAESEAVNRELCRLLVFLEAPDLVSRTLSLIARAPTREDQLHYILHLRNLKTGWSLEERRQYFSWFNQDHSSLSHPHELVQWFRDVRRNYTDGASFSKFLVNIRQEAIQALSEEERAKLAPVLSGETTVAISTAPQRAFVSEWTVEDLLPALDEVSGGRSFARGRQAFTDAQCLACHRFGGEGGSVGPDLTAVASRFTRRDLLESIIDPSRVVSEQFQNTTIITRDGDRISGRLVDEDDRRIALLTNPYTVDRTEVLKSNIKERGHSEISPMPEGLVNILTREEILDLLAYLETDGDPQHAAFAPASR